MVAGGQWVTVTGATLGARCEKAAPSIKVTRSAHIRVWVVEILLLVHSAQPGLSKSVPNKIRPLTCTTVKPIHCYSGTEGGSPRFGQYMYVYIIYI